MKLLTAWLLLSSSWWGFSPASSLTSITGPPQRWKAIEMYSVNPEEYDANPRTATRQFVHFSLENPQHQIVEGWQLDRDQQGRFFTRTVYTFDRYGQMTIALNYESSRIPANKNFSVHH